MNPDTLVRLFWALAIIASGVAFYLALNRWSLLRLRSQHLSLEVIQSGRPALVYFTTPTCAPCKTVQRPAINRLQSTLGDRLQVVEIDASVHPELASQWGVLSVPTTFILDEQGNPQHVNHGIAPYEKLIRQLAQTSSGSH